jgi:hypothetical protein
MKSKLDRRIGSVILLLLIGLIGGCTLFEEDQINPTQIELKPFQFNIEPGQGTANNRITEVWVYANNRYLGAFTPPTKIYYLDSGMTTFTFRPGIRNNGISSDAIAYPMFSAYSIDLEAMPGARYEVNPTTSYLSTVEFPFLSDFELDNPFTDNRDTVAASKVERSTVDVFEGDYSGQITMSEEANFIEVGHALPMSTLPTDGSRIYLEMRYKSEVEMSIGLLGTNLQGDSFSNFFYLVNRSPEWNMLYLELTNYVVASDLDSYKILFRSLYPPNATEPEYNIFIDNIKVVHL